ncbi:nuclear transport factor 2 family protein [Streptomyces sp. NPDC004629]|uniref:nuclear transport factor 2 family protein n=1 Tax=Streptomyces sp. NPDC004629 TaxID=3364705 RepID=UPI0036CC8B75
MPTQDSSNSVRALEVLRAGDTDAARFLQFFTDDSVFQMGNNDAIVGRSAIAKWVGGYLGTVLGVRHRVVEIWERDDTIAVRVEVTYTMGNGEVIILPAMTRMRFFGEHLAEYHIYMDPSPVVAAALPAGASST